MAALGLAAAMAVPADVRAHGAAAHGPPEASEPVVHDHDGADEGPPGPAEPAHQHHEPGHCPVCQCPVASSACTGLAQTSWPGLTLTSDRPARVQPAPRAGPALLFLFEIFHPPRA